MWSVLNHPPTSQPTLMCHCGWPPNMDWRRTWGRQRLTLSYFLWHQVQMWYSANIDPCLLPIPPLTCCKVPQPEHNMGATAPCPNDATATDSSGSSATHAWVAMLVQQYMYGHGTRRHIGAHISHHREQVHCSNTQWQGGIAASQPCLSTPLATPPPSSYTITAAITTTHEWCDHHHYNRHRDQAHHMAQWPMCLPAPASTREWHFATFPGPHAKWGGVSQKWQSAPNVLGLH